MGKDTLDGQLMQALIDAKLKTSEQKTLLLTSTDWDSWYTVIRDTAKQEKIWSFINPDQKPEARSELVRPVYPSFSALRERIQAVYDAQDNQQSADVAGPSTGPVTRTQSLSQAQTPAPEPQPSRAASSLFSTELNEEWQRVINTYKSQEADYTKLESRLINLTREIRKTVGSNFKVYLENCEDAYEMLRSLKQAIQPTDTVRDLYLLREWSKLSKAPRSRSDYEDWFAKWVSLYKKCELAGVQEISPRRAISDFFQAIQPLNDASVEAIRVVVYRDRALSNNFLGVVAEVREIFSLASQQASFKSRGQHGAFSAHTITEEPEDNAAFGATLQGREKSGSRPAGGKSNKSSFPKRDRDSCICGSKHRFASCPYIFKQNRSASFKPDADVEKTVKDKLKIETIQGAINRISKEQKLTCAYDLKGISKPNQDQSEQSPPVKSNFSTATVSQSDYHLRDSVILDSGSTLHITNDKSRLAKFRPPSDDDKLLTGTQKLPILGYGIMTVNIHVDGKVKEIYLHDTAYVQDFHTNIASFNKFADKGVAWHTDIGKLILDGETVADVPRRYGQWVLDYRPIEQPADAAAFPASSFEPRKPSKASLLRWHERLGHASSDAIRHLKGSAEGVEVISLLSNEYAVCETCKLSNSTRIISRRPTERSETPYEKVHFDLIPMNEGGEGEKYILHFQDDYSRMNHVYCIPSKMQTVLMNAVKDFAALINRRWDYRIRIFRSDNEAGLGSNFQSWIAQNGYTHEKSPPFTPEPNGAAERSGRTLTTRARALILSSNLPHHLWPEIYMAAAYLVNRTPSRTLDWDTPVGCLVSHKKQEEFAVPLHHLKAYGCKAYVHKHNTKQLDRLDAKAHIGYLVGYESTNIYRIWIPVLSRVVATRDVVFDEDSIYDPSIAHLQDIERISELISSIALWSPQQLEDEKLESSPYADPEQYTLRMSEPAGDSQQESAEPQSSLESDVAGPVSQLTPDPTPSPTRRQAYAAALADPEPHASFITAFLDAQMYKKQRVHRTDLPSAPDNWKDLEDHPHAAGFKAAAAKEYTDLNSRGTFTSVSKSSVDSRKIIPVRWVFTYKFDTDGLLEKYKARLVVRGDMQPHNHEQEVYAATLASRTVRAVLATAAYFDMDIHQMDAVSAFTNSAIDEEVYVRFPEGFDESGRCLKLQRALYGLRRSPLLWFNDFSSTLERLGLTRVPEAQCLFVCSYAIVFFYVDDVCILSFKEDKAEAEELRRKLLLAYEFKEMGDLKWFLGVRVIRDRSLRKLWLCQDSYIQKIVDSFKLSDMKHPKTPMSTDSLDPHTGKASVQDIYAYQKKVGFLNYAAVVTRPDISRTTQKLAEFLTNPGPEHHAAANRAIAYLAHTKSYALEYGFDRGGALFNVSADASFADNADRKSTEGYLFTLFGGAIDWKSTKQKTVSTSTTEAELLSLSHCAAQTKWWQRFFSNLGLELDEETSIQCDNQQTVRLVVKEAPKLVTKLKHVDVHQHWLRQEVEGGRLKVNWTTSELMAADGFTKALSHQKHVAFLKQLRLVDISRQLSTK